MLIKNKEKMEIGVKVKWQIGREDRPIKCTGIYYHETENNMSLVMMTSKHGIPTSSKIEVLTELLVEDNE